MSQLHALLIGIDYYAPAVIQGGISYGSLGGCVRDTRHVEQFLLHNLDEPPATLRMLTAPVGPHGQPMSAPGAPSSDQPTYENIVKAIQTTLEIAQAGDRVYIHFAGHGGRAQTAYPELKGENGVDEALVPTDIGTSGGRYVRDVELGYLLMQLRDAGLIVAVTLDSCHSGGSLRGETDMMIRGVNAIDQAARPTDSLVAGHNELVAAWTATGGGNARAAKPASNWLLEPTGYVLLAACRASEFAYEFAFNGRERNGALTYWLLDTLRTGGLGYTYKMVHDRVLAKVHSQFAAQTPVLEGEGDRPFFGIEKQSSVWAVPVLQVDPAHQRVRLNAGDAHGLRPGARFDIFPLDARDLQDPTQRRGVVELTELDDVQSWARIVEPADAPPIEQGDRAVLTTPVDVRILRRVRVPIPDATLRTAVEHAINQDGRGYVTVADSPLELDFQVDLDVTGQFYEILDAAGEPLPHLRPALPVGKASLPQLVRRLIHLAKYQAILELDMPDRFLLGKVDVRLENKSRPVASGQTPAFYIGDEVSLAIENLLPPVGLADSSHDLNITVLLLEADWSISQIFPAHFAAFETVGPGQTIAPEFVLGFPEACAQDHAIDHVTDTIKVFVTQKGTNFRWLELPPLDEPDLPRAATRSAVTDPLEAVLAAVAEARPGERSMRPTSSPSQGRGWTVVQQQLCIKRQPET